MHKPPYRREDGHWLIELRLASPRQLFNTIDPSPFHEKDVDDAAERYIIGAVENFAEEVPLQLVIHLPDEHRTDENRNQLGSALRNFSAGVPRKPGAIWPVFYAMAASVWPSASAFWCSAP